MRMGLPLSLIAALSVASCQRVRSSGDSQPQPLEAMSSLGTNALPSMTKNEAEGLMTSIHVGMTVGEIRKVFPHATLEQEPTVEHGGVWFGLPVSEDYYIQFQAARPKAGDTVEHSRINYSPRLRDRKTMTFIAGEERPW